MESQLIVINVNSRRGIEVKGRVHSEAKRSSLPEWMWRALLLHSGRIIDLFQRALGESFAFNLGRDGSNLLLHLNPRFDSEGDFQTIVCNSMQGGEWGEVQRDNRFPFQKGEEAVIWFSFDAKNVTAKVSEEHEIKFPNRLGLERVEYLSVDGDFKVQHVKID